MPMCQLYLGPAPFTLLRILMVTEQNLSVSALRSHWYASNTELFECANRYAYFQLRCVMHALRFQCENQIRRNSNTTVFFQWGYLCWNRIISIVFAWSVFIAYLLGHEAVWTGTSFSSLEIRGRIKMEQCEQGLPRHERNFIVADFSATVISIHLIRWIFAFLQILDPEKRLGCEEMGGYPNLKAHEFFTGYNSCYSKIFPNFNVSFIVKHL